MSRILSPLLSTRDNALLCNLLHHDCSVLACGVVQLVMAAPPQKKEWKSHSFGVLCLVQDKSLNSTFMRLYCLKKAKLEWEQELFTPFQYSETCPFFHTFPGDECQVGINFADKNEAKQFYVAVQKQISESKATQSTLMRRYSVGAVSDWKAKLENCLRGNELQKRLSLRKPKVSNAMSSQRHDSSFDEDSMSLAKRKGPLPPLPLHARTDTLQTNNNTNVQNVDTSVSVLPFVPPPPSYRAPIAPQISAVKDPYSPGKTLDYNTSIEDESGYDDYL